MNGATDPVAGAVDPASGEAPAAAPAKFEVDDVLELTRYALPPSQHPCAAAPWPRTLLLSPSRERSC